VARWLRWTGYGLLGVLALVTVALAVVYWVVGARLDRVYRFPDAGVHALTDTAALTRGRYLVEVIGKCSGCHGADYGGKVIADNFMFGRLWAGNLTAGKGGVGAFTDADLEHAIRHGVRRDGRPLVFMPAEAYGAMTDRDLAVLLGYLRSLPPVNREIPTPRVAPVARALYLFGGFPLLPVELVNHTAPRPELEAGVTVEYGRYLATIGGCRACHGMELKGDANPDAPALDRAHIGSWTEADFFRALREGRRPDGTVLDPEKMPWVESGRMTDDEIRAVWRYIHS